MSGDRGLDLVESGLENRRVWSSAASSVCEDNLTIASQYRKQYRQPIGNYF
jgi:hypothetical protein